MELDFWSNVTDSIEEGSCLTCETNASYVGGVSSDGPLISFCAKNASTITMRIGNAALRKKRLISRPLASQNGSGREADAMKLIDLAHDRSECWHAPRRLESAYQGVFTRSKADFVPGQRPPGPPRGRGSCTSVRNRARSRSRSGWGSQSRRSGSEDQPFCARAW